MKKLFAAAFGLCLLGGVAIAATQYNNVGAINMSTSTVTGGLGLWAISIARINALTPTTTGQAVFCTDCVANGAKGTICVSTGSTTTFQFVLSTGTACR